MYVCREITIHSSLKKIAQHLLLKLYAYCNAADLFFRVLMRLNSSVEIWLWYNILYVWNTRTRIG